jgi:hypothetical protein
MASALPGDVCQLQRNACLLRIAKLDSDCSPTGGADSGIVTAGIVTMTASPEVEEGTVFEPKNGCGRIMATVADPDLIKRYNLTGEILTWDAEMFEVLFGGDRLVGVGGGSYPSENIGWASTGTSNPNTRGVYLEVITQRFAEGLGDCAGAAADFTPYVGHVFGKVLAVPGDFTFENDVSSVTFSGKAFQNPNLFDGPWNDWPAVGYIKNSPYQWVGYSQSQYDAMLAVSGCGYVTLPAAS